MRYLFLLSPVAVNFVVNPPIIDKISGVIASKLGKMDCTICFGYLPYKLAFKCQRFKFSLTPVSKDIQCLHKSNGVAGWGPKGGGLVP